MIPIKKDKGKPKKDQCPSKTQKPNISRKAQDQPGYWQAYANHHAGVHQ
jgi:hypothetical protein